MGVANGGICGWAAVLQDAVAHQYAHFISLCYSNSLFGGGAEAGVTSAG